LAKSRWIADQRGFSLVEVMTATSIMAVAVASLAQLFVIAVNANRSARTTTFAAVLAQQKMEQLRGLTWGFDTIGLPISDTDSDTTVSPSLPAGGSGLTPSPQGTLRANTVGYVDYLDDQGVSLGGGANPPNNTIYIRRWSVEPLPTNPNNTLILQVLVTRLNTRGGDNSTEVRRMPDEARLVSVKTRKAS
jgi:prepilin-type N-terminal cleavage/methylation domain-containing protein